MLKYYVNVKLFYIIYRNTFVILLNSVKRRHINVMNMIWVNSVIGSSLFIRLNFKFG